MTITTYRCGCREEGAGFGQALCPAHGEPRVSACSIGREAAFLAYGIVLPPAPARPLFFPAVK